MFGMSETCAVGFGAFPHSLFPQRSQAMSFSYDRPATAASISTVDMPKVR